MRKRTLLQFAAGLGGLGLLNSVGRAAHLSANGASAAAALPARAQVLVLGGGAAGALVAQHIREMGQQRVEVLWLEPGSAVAIDRHTRRVRLASGAERAYDSLVLAESTTPSQLQPALPQVVPSQMPVQVQAQDAAASVMARLNGWAPGPAESVLGG
jgi:NADPH-dependent 2,4-dienoyl-CoA reductase/sulfur reductase-like enzyme